MKHSSLTELPQLKTDLAQLNYAWEGTPPFQLPHRKFPSQRNCVKRKPRLRPRKQKTITDDMQ